MTLSLHTDTHTPATYPAGARDRTPGPPKVTAIGTPAWDFWVREHWPNVSMRDAVMTRDAPTRLTARVCVRLGSLLPADVRVSLVGRARRDGEAEAFRMFPVASLHNGRYRYAAELAIEAGAPSAWQVVVAPAPSGLGATPVDPIERALIPARRSAEER